MEKTERKYMAHYLDAAFDTTYAATNYIRLGDDLEEFNVDLNPDIEIRKNILGENSVVHNGYEPTSDADPYYHKHGDDLSEKIMELAMSRSTSGRTSYVEVLLRPGDGDSAPTVVSAYREDVIISPTSYGGDTSGVQVPFTINYAGNRVKGDFDVTTKKFTASGDTL